MAYDPYPYHQFDSSYGQSETLGQYTTKTFLWMFLGLLITFAAALVLCLTGLVVYIFPIQFILAIAELLIVIYLSARIHNMSVGTARMLFLAYALLNAVTFSSLLVYYGLFSMVLVFGMTALYFGGLAAYGYFTKSDLSGYRPILFTGLIVLLVFWVLSLFLNLSGFDRVACVVGIAIFMGYTAYDSQMIRDNYYYYSGNPDLLEKASVFSALQLYLDFVNLFIYLLRFMNKRRD